VIGLAWLKRRLCRHMLIIEFCRDCGRRVRHVWTAPDPLWIALNKSDYERDPSNFGALCLDCFDARARRAGLRLRWIPEAA